MGLRFHINGCYVIDFILSDSYKLGVMFRDMKYDIQRMYLPYKEEYAYSFIYYGVL